MLDLNNLKLKEGTEAENEINFSKIEPQLYLSPIQKIEKQPIAISIGKHEYKGNRYHTPYGSYGDFSCIVGASKSKKTFLKSLLTACYIGGNAYRYAPEIAGHQSKDKYIIEFETEQSKFHTQLVSKRTLEMVGIDFYENYRTYYLRELSPRERTQFIEYMLLESDYKNQIGLFTIDGIADLITDINSVEQATHITEKLLQWTAKTKAHGITILHRNFGSQKPTGHLGSFVLKKAETVLFVELNGVQTLVKPEYARNIPFEEFVFELDQNHLPKVINNWE